MIIALWILNALLALAFVAAGSTKLLRSKAQLHDMMAWTHDVSPAGIKAVGAIELIGGLGLVIPLATQILPILTPIAAVGLTLTMAGAVAMHVKMKDVAKAGMASIVLGALSLASAILGFIVI